MDKYVLDYFTEAAILLTTDITCDFVGLVDVVIRVARRAVGLVTTFKQSFHSKLINLVVRQVFCTRETASPVIEGLYFIHKKIRGGDEAFVGFY